MLYIHSSQIKEAVKIKITNAELMKHPTFYPVILGRISCRYRTCLVCVTQFKQTPYGSSEY